LQKIETLLDEAGSSKEQMLRVTIWLADMDDFKGLNEVWKMWVPDVSCMTIGVQQNEFHT